MLMVRHNDRIKRVSSFRTHLKKHNLNPDSVDLDSCVVIVSRDDPEEDSTFLRVPRTRRSQGSRASSRSCSPYSSTSSVSSFDDVSDTSSPCVEPAKDFREFPICRSFRLTTLTGRSCSRNGFQRRRHNFPHVAFTTRFRYPHPLSSGG